MTDHWWYWFTLTPKDNVKHAFVMVIGGNTQVCTGRVFKMSEIYWGPLDAPHCPKCVTGLVTMELQR